MKSEPRKIPRRHIWIITLCLLGMYGFSYALIPLYSTFCKVTGLNGKIDGRTRLAPDQTVDQSRTVTVQFTTILNGGMPWVFYPNIPKIQIHPGEKRQVTFHAKNMSDREIVGQAIPSISPGQAARHFQKTECFCFSQQKLAPGEVREMPLVFFLDRDLPAEIQELTLAYTLFDTALGSQTH